MKKNLDYKRELEAIARNMILVHEPDVLIRMIARMIVERLKVAHASILLYDADAYRLTVSRGSLASHIPVGLARIDKENPLVLFFREHKYESFSDGRAVMAYARAKEVLAQGKLTKPMRQLLGDVVYQMEVFEAAVCVPCFFRKELLGILLLGRKNNGEEFSGEDLDFFVALSSNVAMAIKNAQLFSQLSLELDKKRQLFMRTTVALAAAIEAKDHYTHGHTTRVTNISLAIARMISQKRGQIIKPEFMEALQIASLLHDIGKIGVPEEILNKKGPLTEVERKKIREHPLIGVAILKPIKELGDSVLGVKYHHERPDGTGYPDGLKGENIPLIASIIAVADSFDAMTTNRPYRRSLSKEEAIKEIKRLSGKQFDAKVCVVFLELCNKSVKF